MFHLVNGNKIIVCLLLLLMVLGFAGCAPATTDDVTQPDETPIEEPEETPVDPGDAPLVPYVNKNLDFYFFVILQESIKRSVEERGWTFEASVPEAFDSAQQFDQFRTWIAREPMMITANPIDSEGIIGAIDAATAAGIPVGVVDTPTTGGEVALTIAFDNYEAGIMAAQLIIDRLVEKYGEPRGVVLNAYGDMASWAWRLRKEGFDAKMAEYPDITYLAIPGQGDMVLTHDALMNALTMHPDLDAVHAPSDHPARGLAEALQKSDRWFKVGEEGHVIFVTIDAEPIAMRMIREGYYDATVHQDAVSYGQMIIELMEQYTLNGEPVPLGTYSNPNYIWEEAEIVDSPSGPYMNVPPTAVDASNVDDPRLWGNVAFDDWGIPDE